MAKAFKIIARDVATGSIVKEWTEPAEIPRPRLGDRIPDGGLMWQVVGARDDSEQLLELDVKFLNTY